MKAIVFGIFPQHHWTAQTKPFLSPFLSIRKSYVWWNRRAQRKDLKQVSFKANMSQPQHLLYWALLLQHSFHGPSTSTLNVAKVSNCTRISPEPETSPFPIFTNIYLVTVLLCICQAINNYHKSKKAKNHAQNISSSHQNSFLKTEGLQSYRKWDCILSEHRLKPWLQSKWVPHTHLQIRFLKLQFASARHAPPQVLACIKSSKSQLWNLFWPLHNSIELSFPGSIFQLY